MTQEQQIKAIAELDGLICKEHPTWDFVFTKTKLRLLALALNQSGHGKNTQTHPL